MTTRSTGRSLKDDRKLISGAGIVSVILYVLYFVLMVITIYNKGNYHVDELLSYGLSNNHSALATFFEDGVTYTADNDPFKEYLTADKEARFDYKMVWQNQENDVHPPLYYAILHTICSFFPGSFSKWYAASINIIFALLLLFVARKTFRLLVDDELICDLFSLAFILSSGILSMVSFLRMYVMAMFWAALLTCLIIKHVVAEPADKKGKFLFYVKVFAVALCGALTHYYCIMFTVFMCASLSVFWIVKKKWLPVLYLVITGGLVAGGTYLIFPAFIKHMFSGYRGEESLKNMKQTPGEYWIRLKSYMNIVESEIGGGLLGIILAVLALTALLCLFQKLRKKTVFGVKGSDGYRLDVFALIFPALVLYFLFVSKSASYMESRYMSPSYAVILISIVALVFILLSRLFKREHALVILIVLLSVICVNNWKDNNWNYLYKSFDQIEKKAQEHRDLDAVYVYKIWWHALPSYNELRNYRSVTFVQEENLALLDETDIKDKDQLIVFVPDNDEQKLNDMMQHDSKLTVYEQIGRYGKSMSYYVH